jgi:hypothetical protein
LCDKWGHHVPDCKKAHYTCTNYYDIKQNPFKPLPKKVATSLEDRYADWPRPGSTSSASFTPKVKAPPFVPMAKAPPSAPMVKAPPPGAYFKPCPSTLWTPPPPAGTIITSSITSLWKPPPPAGTYVATIRKTENDQGTEVKVKSLKLRIRSDLDPSLGDTDSEDHFRTRPSTQEAATTITTTGETPTSSSSAAASSSSVSPPPPPLEDIPPCDILRPPIVHPWYLWDPFKQIMRKYTKEERTRGYGKNELEVLPTQTGHGHLYLANRYNLKYGLHAMFRILFGEVSKPPINNHFSKGTDEMWAKIKEVIDKEKWSVRASLSTSARPKKNPKKDKIKRSQRSPFNPSRRTTLSSRRSGPRRKKLRLSMNRYRKKLQEEVTQGRRRSTSATAARRAID